jgi:hypothetical protein
MQKSLKKSATGMIAIMTVVMVISAFATINKAYAVDIQPPISMWMDPPQINYTTATLNVGDKFNVTVWVNAQNDTVTQQVFTWQIKVGFDPSLLVCTGAGYSAGTISQFFQGQTTIPVTPVISATDVAFGETLLSGNKTGNASLCWIEFQVGAAPNDTTPTLSSNLEFMGLPTADTFLLDPDLNAVSSLVGYNATFNYSVAAADTTPPTIGEVSTTPSGNEIQENTAVSVNATITDDPAGSGVANAILSYTVDNGTTWTNVTLTSSGTTWSGTIPGQVNGAKVSYFITAIDNAGNSANTPTGETAFSYNVIPEFTVAILIALMTLLTVAMIAYRKKLVRLP